jgi:hypothetical protein
MLKANQTSQDTLPMSSIPPTVAAAAGAADSSDDSSEIAVWGQGEDEPDLSVHRLIRIIKASQEYSDAVEYLSTRKYGGPKTWRK